MKNIYKGKFYVNFIVIFIAKPIHLTACNIIDETIFLSK